MVTTSLSRFNEQLENLLLDLIKILPNNIEIKLFYEKFNLLKKIDPKKILLIFLKYIYPYKQKIMNEDESYFLNEYTETELLNNKELQKEAEVDNEYILTKAINLKNLWKNKLNDQNKNTVKMYFKVLVFLCEKYLIENK